VLSSLQTSEINKHGMHYKSLNSDVCLYNLTLTNNIFQCCDNNLIEMY
jgi:hypothetical protein